MESTFFQKLMDPTNPGHADAQKLLLTTSDGFTRDQFIQFLNADIPVIDHCDFNVLMRSVDSKNGENLVYILCNISIPRAIALLDDSDDPDNPAEDGINFLEEAGILQDALIYMASVDIHRTDWPHVWDIDPKYLPIVSPPLIAFFTQPLSLIFRHRCKFAADLGDNDVSLYDRLLQQPAVFKAIIASRPQAQYHALVQTINAEISHGLTIQHCMAIALLPTPLFNHLVVPLRSVETASIPDADDCWKWCHAIAVEGLTTFFVRLHDYQALANLIVQFEERNTNPDVFVPILQTFSHEDQPIGPNHPPSGDSLLHLAIRISGLDPFARAILRTAPHDPASKR